MNSLVLPSSSGSVHYRLSPYHENMTSDLCLVIQNMHLQLFLKLLKGTIEIKLELVKMINSGVCMQWSSYISLLQTEEGKDQM